MQHNCIQKSLYDSTQWHRSSQTHSVSLQCKTTQLSTLKQRHEIVSMQHHLIQHCDNAKLSGKPALHKLQSYWSCVWKKKQSIQILYFSYCIIFEQVRNIQTAHPTNRKMQKLKGNPGQIYTQLYKHIKLRYHSLKQQQ